MSKATPEKASELSRSTAEFVRRVIKKICEKSGLQVIACGATSQPPLDYLSSIKLGRWFPDAEYPRLSRMPGFHGYGFPSGLSIMVKENQHFFLCFFPDHPLKPQLASVAENGYGVIDLNVVQQYIEENNADMLKMYASMIRVAIVDAILADEQGLEEYRRPPFSCPDIDPGD